MFIKTYFQIFDLILTRFHQRDYLEAFGCGSHAISANKFQRYELNFH